MLGFSTALIPLAIFYSIYMLYAFRIVAGLVSAVWFPGFYQIWALWAPPNERGILIGLSFAGVHIGNAITLPIAGALCQTSFGWPLVFYFYGASCIAYVFLWFLFIYDTPTQHPMISESEKSFIISVCGTAREKREKKPPAPVLAMLKSLPLWAFIVMVVGYDWNSYTFLTSMPAFMREALRFDIDENTGLSALPYIGLWCGQFISGWLSDWILSRKFFSVTIVRKLMTAVGMFGPAIMLLLISFLDCRAKYAVVALFTVGLILNSGVFVGGLLNPVELSPQYAGLIFSAANTLSSLTGVGAPLLASVLTQNGSYEEWRNVFFVGATIYFVTGLFFVLFSSSSLQRWSHGVTEPRQNGELELAMDAEGAKNEEASGGLVHSLRDLNGQPVENSIFNPSFQQEEVKSRKVDVSV
ncbi:hypothetical protein EG68_00210 [Paragonimus skrjabini miyazakii]|uniref:Major facilitator superfamily (MFS) profile domain-containing protein n=1 Tax=Paragonimus skrjabini miyazakii TaxID=59628 RepID=A0A8S9Z6I9_9TREM|nr:hypothetical protein EG68_00210 [Paragonimus skrjabini miyazakii]